MPRKPYTNGRVYENRELFKSFWDRGIRPGPPVIPPEESDDDDDEELVEDGPELDIYFTLMGNKAGIVPTEDRDTVFFIQDGVNAYLRTLAHWVYFCRDLSPRYPPKNDVDKARVTRYFELDQAFVDSFTPNWNLLTIMSLDQTTGEYYILAIIHNGHYPNELEQILHLMPEPGDPPNIQVFELCTYANHYHVPMSRLNIYWDDIYTTLQPHRERDFVRVEGDVFDGFIRSLQFMLLSYYIPDPNSNIWIYMPAWFIGNQEIENEPWYNERKHEALDHNIRKFGYSIDSYMRCYRWQESYPGHYVLAENLICHSDDN